MTTGTANNSVLGLKIDVDTLVGYRSGVPALLEQLRLAGVRGSFFFAVGPDRSGVAIRRVFTQRGFIGKMLRNRALATYGLRTALYGTLLRAPAIVASDPGILRAVAQAGHEVGVHGWDHVAWHDHVGRTPAIELRDQLSRAFDAIANITGAPPKSFAAPGWQCSAHALTHHDDVGLDYASDARGGGGAFLPRLGGRVFKTPQIPTSLPTLDEMWGRQVRDARDAVDIWAGLLREGVNVLTAHAEIEGMAMLAALPAFTTTVKDRGVTVQSLADIARAADKKRLPIVDVAPRRLPGRAGKVWCAINDP